MLKTSLSYLKNLDKSLKKATALKIESEIKVNNQTLELIRKLEWSDKNPLNINLFEKNLFYSDEDDYLKYFQENSGLNKEKVRGNFLNLLGTLLLKNLEGDYLRFNKILIFVDGKEVLLQDLDFLNEYIENEIKGKHKKVDKKMKISFDFTSNIIELTKKAAFFGDKIEIYFISSQDYLDL